MSTGTHPPEPAGLPAWFDALERRHFASLTFPEVRHGVQALSRIYVQDRDRRISAALSGAGKRAAFGFFYGTIHFLLIREIVRQLHAAEHAIDRILDLGCGTGVGGAAWALEADRRPSLTGVERNRWAASEARWTYRALGLKGTVRSADLERVRLPGRGAGILLTFAANELDDAGRTRLADRLLGASGEGAAVLVVESIARKLAPWWEDWVARFEAAGATAERWRFQASLPEQLRLLDRAAGLDHRELTGRSLWLPGRRAPQAE